MPALWTPAAVRSQAVAARTYAAYERAHARAGHYQLCDTTSCQVYGGYSAEHPAANAAIDATRQQVLTSGGDPAFTQFSSSSGGWTSAGSLLLPARQARPVRRLVGQPGPRLVHEGHRRAARAPVAGGRQPHLDGDRPGTATASGAAGSARVRLTGSRGTVQVSGDSFRAALGLRSTWLTFRVARR